MSTFAVNFEPTSAPAPGEANVTCGVDPALAVSPSASSLPPQAPTRTAMTPGTGSTVNVLRFMRLLLTWLLPAERSDEAIWITTRGDRLMHPQRDAPRSSGHAHEPRAVPPLRRNAD